MQLWYQHMPEKGVLGVLGLNVFFEPYIIPYDAEIMYPFDLKNIFAPENSTPNAPPQCHFPLRILAT